MALQSIKTKYKNFLTCNRIVLTQLKNCSNEDECEPKSKKKSSQYQITTFNNGFRVATKELDIPICTIGLWVKTGSRWESNKLNGIAHFHEHLIEKGVPDLKKKLDSLGIQFNSLATREINGFYAVCSTNQIPNMIQIFSDIVKFDDFDDKIIDSVRQVCLNEMKENDSNYRKVVFDFLHSTAFQGTAMGQSTFGPTQNVTKFTSREINKYVSDNYKGSRMVLSAVGNIPHQEVIEKAEDAFGEMDDETFYLDPCRFTGSEIRYRDDSLPLVYAAVAVETCPLNDPDFFPLCVAAATVGVYKGEPYGHNHSSLLIRAAAIDGLAERFHSFHINYSDTSLWGIYFEGDPLGAENMIYNIQSEWMKLCTAVTAGEVERGKNSLKLYFGNLLSGLDKICINMGKQLLYTKNIFDLPEIFVKIEQVDKTAVQNACMKYIYDVCPAVACLGSVEAFPDYQRLRSGMFWLRF